MSVSSTRKNFSASMVVTSLANLSPSLVESGCWKFNHLHPAAAIKFARQGIANRAARFARRKPALEVAKGSKPQVLTSPAPCPLSRKEGGEQRSRKEPWVILEACGSKEDEHVSAEIER